MKKLSIAIYWHMHQPVYEIENTYLMPWTRLHAVKDYLDMVLYLERFPKLKMNVDLVPALIDTILEYSNGTNDIHSELTLTKVDSMSQDEKAFVLNNFFNVKYETMIFKSEHYKELFKKRFAKEGFSPADFSDNELSDLMALFNLVWIDPIHYERYPHLKELWNKQYGYTLDDRTEIINIHRQIMSEIIPTYKKYLQQGRIEITASSYYHAILPILIDSKTTLKSIPEHDKYPAKLNMKEDAVLQIKLALDRIEEVFGIRPKGFWPPELCVCSKMLHMLAKEGIKWTIADEGILSGSINFDFVRDFNGNLNDPYKLLKVYEYKTRKNTLDIIFRDRSIPSLINFEYAGMDFNIAANNLYDKIKTIQNRILISPDDTHMLTIAQDGENCWENYENDGNDFLEKFYSLIENDDTLETVLISDYIEHEKHKKPLRKICPGSGIDRTFKCWIGEQTKNKAWHYIQAAKDAYNKKAPEVSSEDAKIALNELMISQGSDWFWWYGEPNNSGQDFVFDYMFREHIKNVYIALGIEFPQYLNDSLITKVEMPFKRPLQDITPRMDGSSRSNSDWQNSGLISLLDGPVHRENKNIDKINFGCDENNIYFRLHVNKDFDKNGFIDKINQFYIYMRNSTNAGARAYIRLINKTDTLYPILSEKFENELTLTLIKDTLYPLRLSKCLHKNIWTLGNSESVSMVYKDVIDLSIPFETLGINEGDTVEFFIANTDSGVKNTYLPQEILLSMTRKK